MYKAPTTLWEGTLKKDNLSVAGRSGNVGLAHKINKKIANRFTDKIIISHIEKKGVYKNFKNPPSYQEFVNDVKRYDAIIQVRGSFSSIFTAPFSLTMRYALFWPISLFLWLVIVLTISKNKTLTMSPAMCLKEYMAAFVNLINEIIRSGKQVIAFSTCTGIDSYHNDDRMIALQMKDIVES